MALVDDVRLAALLSVARQYGDGDIIRVGIEDLAEDLKSAQGSVRVLDDAINQVHAWLVTECTCDHARVEQAICDARNAVRATE